MVDEPVKIITPQDTSRKTNSPEAPEQALDIITDDNDTVKQIEKAPNYRETVKFNDFVRYYNDRESETFGNQVQSAIKAYNLDPKTQYHSAAVIAGENLKKLKYIARDYLERIGLPPQKLLAFAAKKMTDEKTPEPVRPQWYDRIVRMAGLEETEPINVTFNTQNNQTNIFNTNPDQRKDWNASFIRFLEGEKPNTTD